MAHTINKRAVGMRYRSRLLLERPEDGSATLAERLSGGLHYGSPPDNATYPYGAIRVLNLRPHPIDAPFFVADVELQLWHRPRSAQEALQDATDAAINVAVGFVDLATGIYETEVRDADEMPPFTESADPEVITTRTVFAVTLYPVS